MARREVYFKIGGLELSRPAPARRPRRVALSDVPNLTVSPSRKEPVPVVKGKEPVIVGVTGNGGRNFCGMSTGEYVKVLAGATGRAIFDEMRRSDPQVRAVLNAITLPIRSASYSVEPASDSPEDVKIAETIEDNLLHGMTQTWDDTLRHALLMLPMGFSVLEKVWEYRDGILGIRKLDPRLPISVIDWKWDTQTEELIGPEQMDSQGRRYVLPIEKILVFTNEKEGDNWEGVSILRPAYKPWFIKSQLEKIDAIKHDRYGVGIPTMKAAEGVTSGSSQWTDAEETLENIQAQEVSYMMLPAGWEFDIAGGQGKAGTDVLASIKYHDGQIAKSVLAQFIDLGSTETGSRALGASFIDLFLQSLQATAGYLCEVINRFLIPEYVGYNWAAKEFPQLRVGKIMKLDPAVLSTLKTAGLISSDLELENAIRDQLELPEKKQEDEPVLAPAAPAAPVSPTTVSPDDTADPESPEDAPAEEPPADAPKAPVKQAEPKPTRRLADFAPEELLIDIAGISVQLDNARASALHKVLAIRDDQRRALIEQAVAMRRIAAVNVPRKRDMYDALLEAFRSQLEIGKAQVKKEIERQTRRSAAFEDERKVVDQPELFDLVQDELSLKVEGAGNKLESMIFDIAIKARKAGFVGDALRREIVKQAGAISDATWEAIVDGAVNGGWGAGRDAAAAVYADEVDHVYRSAILDTATCDICQERDGQTWPTVDEAQIMPDPECLGGGRCRCINIFVMKAESEPAIKQSAPPAPRNTKKRMTVNRDASGNIIGAIITEEE